MLKKILLWLLVIALSLQIFSFSSENAEESGGLSEKVTKVVVKVIKEVKEIPPQKQVSFFEIVHKIVRKTAHFAEYTLLAIAVFALSKSYALKNVTSFFISIVYCLFFATSDEIHQLYVPGRHGAVLDVVLDGSGALFGNGIAVLFLHIKRMTRKKTKKV